MCIVEEASHSQRLKQRHFGLDGHIPFAVERSAQWAPTLPRRRTSMSCFLGGTGTLLEPRPKMLVAWHHPQCVERLIHLPA